MKREEGRGSCMDEGFVAHHQEGRGVRRASSGERKLQMHREIHCD